MIEDWSKAAGLWFENSDSIIRKNFGPMIAQGAEAKVYYKAGDPSVAKERTSIYSTTQKALEAIALHKQLKHTSVHPVTIQNRVNWNKSI